MKLKRVLCVLMATGMAGVYPDVILRAVGFKQALTETFIRDNNLVDLSEVVSMTIPGETVTVGDKMLPGFLENSIVNPYGDGKTYLMPMLYGPCGLFFNQGLFDEKRWTVPPPGVRCRRWERPPRRKELLCSPNPPQDTLTLSCMLCCMKH